MFRAYWDILQKKAKIFWLWLWRKDVIIFLLFVGLASIFWWGQAMSSPRDMRMRIPVTYIDIPDCVSLGSALPESIEIIVRDEGKQLLKVRRQDLHLHVNLSGYMQQDCGELALVSEILRPRLLEQLPGSMRLQHISPEEHVVEYTCESSKKVAVRLQASVRMAEQYHLVSAVRLTPDSVEVYGEGLDSIDYIETDSILVEGLRDTVRKAVSLRVPEGLRLSNHSVEAEWVSEQFTEKGFTLPISVRGVPEGERIRLFPQVADVTVRVSVKHFASVVKEDLELYCDYPAVEEIDCLELQVTSNNPHVRYIRIQPHQVEYIIER